MKIDTKEVKMINVLDSTMFDDGSMDCRTFGLANSETTYYVSWETIKAMFPHLIETIQNRVSQDQYHLVLSKEDHDEYLEIQWGD